MKLDKKDRSLLNLLYINSRESFVSLGKKLRLSNTAVERRLAILQKQGAISLLLADVHFAKMGLRSFRLYFKFDVMDRKTEEEVIKVFKAHPRTLWGVICEGEYDVLWRIITADEIEVEQAASMMVERFGPKIIEKTVVTTTYQTYLPWNRALESSRSAAFPLEGITAAKRPDETDVKILSALYGNSRITTVELSKIAGLSPDAVKYRMKRLEKEGYILGYTVWFDAKKLGFDYYKFLIGFRSITKEKERAFLKFCSSHDNVVFLNKTIGSWDIEVDIIARDNTELHEFTREIKTKFGHIIGRHTFISAVEERMLNPLRGE